MTFEIYQKGVDRILSWDGRKNITCETWLKL